ncbi:MAG: 2-oxoacid:acceptor oxidoreductase family protein [Candidatus Omnitrophota bacterium]
MKSLLEITWHGRGGQGAVTAAKLVAEAALLEGKHIQAFPEYGAERSGAPVRSYTRISDTPIRIHSQVKTPDIVIILDPTLLAAVDVTAGVREDGIFIVNTPLSPKDMRKELDISGRRIFTVDATSISIENLGRNIPNTPMVGALIKVAPILKPEKLMDYFKEQYASKFNSSVIEGNLKAIKAAYEAVKGE